MFEIRDYVRLKMAPRTRMGTIQDIRKSDEDSVEYLFRQDTRLDPAAQMKDTWLLEDDLEYASLPSDKQIAQINAAIRLGSGS
jgi:hypothetical protein